MIAVTCGFVSQHDLSLFSRTQQDEFLWVKSRKSSDLLRLTRSDIRISRETDYYYECQFSASPQENVLAHFPKQECIRLVINEFQPHIDTSFVRKQNKTVWISGGTMTVEQLSDLTNNNNSQVVLQNVSIVQPLDETTLRTDIELTGGLRIAGKTGQVSQVLNSIESFAKVGFIVIRAGISAKDWWAIARASHQCRIIIHEPSNLDESPSIPQDRLIEPFPSADCIRLTNNVSFSSASNIKTKFSKLSFTQGCFLNRTDGKLWLHNMPRQDDMYWNLLFAYPNRIAPINLNYVTKRSSLKLGLEQAAIKYHWAYGFNEQQEITDLFLPAGIDDQLSQLDQLMNLKSISIDSSWLFGFSPGTTSWHVDFSLLPPLPELEKLYLGIGSSWENIAAFARNSKLKHLSIGVGSNLFGFPVRDLDQLPSLESLTFYGEPEPSTLVEIKKLPNLKRLRIVDFLGTQFSTAPPFDNLQAS